MNGNVEEWTDDFRGQSSGVPMSYGHIGYLMGVANSTYGNDYYWYPFEEDEGAVWRGGDWLSGGYAGCFAVNLNLPPSYAYSLVGFRCCSSSNLESGCAVNQTFIDAPLILGGVYDSDLWLMNGRVDEVAIWNVSRTSSQISSDMNGNIDTQNNMVGYWKMNADSGILKCPNDFSKLIVQTDCGGVSDTFDTKPKCA